MNDREFGTRILVRARQAGVGMTPDLAIRLEIYFRALATWNRKINLTGLDLDEGTDEAIDRLLIEPVAAAGHVVPTATRMIDIGSGGGSPAIPLALARPGLALLMVESKTRKSVFLREVVRALELPDASVITARFEELLSRADLHETYDLLTVRAVRIEGKTMESVQAFVRPGGQLFLFKRDIGTSGADDLAPPLVLRDTYPLVESLRSSLVVLDKLPASHDVPRGTP